MKDTPSKIGAKFRAMLLDRSEDRLKMGCSMHATSQALVRASVFNQYPYATPAVLKQALFLRFYGNDFEPGARKRIFGHYERRGKKTEAETEGERESQKTFVDFRIGKNIRPPAFDGGFYHSYSETILKVVSMNLPQSQKVRRVRAKPRLAEVVRVDRLTPHMVRVIFAGEDLEGFTTRGPAEHLKVNFPPPGESKLVLPEWGPEGPILPEGQQRPLNRTYTPRRWDLEVRELTVDFLLHGEGPGSRWAQQARPGQVVAVSHQPGGAYKVDVEADWYLICGDEAALPAVGTLLEALPASCFAHVFVEATDAAEEIELESPARFQVTWLHHGGAAGRVGRRLEQAVRQFPFPEGSGRVWIGCEAGVMRDIRRHLLNEGGMDRAHAHTQGYWKYGAVNHPDNDRGQDVE